MSLDQRNVESKKDKKRKRRNAMLLQSIDRQMYLQISAEKGYCSFLALVESAYYSDVTLRWKKRHKENSLRIGRTIWPHAQAEIV